MKIGGLPPSGCGRRVVVARRVARCRRLSGPPHRHSGHRGGVCCTRHRQFSPPWFFKRVRGTDIALYDSLAFSPLFAAISGLALWLALGY
jgi:hypothetical protein